MTSTGAGKNLVNHFFLLLDESGSMAGFTNDVVRVVGNQVKRWGQRSTDLNQETRVSIFAFGNFKYRCLIWDTDVLRVPSIQGLYRPTGNTPMIQSTLGVLDEIKANVSEKYGDHAFLMYVLTDGDETQAKHLGGTLRKRLDTLPDNYTVAALVPNLDGKQYAQDYGFPKGNIAIWDVNAKDAVDEVGDTIDKATEAFMVARQSGTRSSRNLFAMNTTAVTRDAVTKAGLAALPGTKYTVKLTPGDLAPKTQIDRFVATMGETYRVGKCYYELVKPEFVAPDKEIALFDKRTDQVYVGPQTRQLLGLPDHKVKVDASKTPDYIILVQSNSYNRHLTPNSKILILK